MVLATNNINQIHLFKKVDLDRQWLVLSVTDTELTEGVISPSVVFICPGSEKAMHSTGEYVNNVFDAQTLVSVGVEFVLASFENPSARCKVLSVASDVGGFSNQQQSVIVTRNNFFQFFRLFLVF